jgi:hypothetical protein
MEEVGKLFLRVLLRIVYFLWRSRHASNKLMLTSTEITLVGVVTENLFTFTLSYIKTTY